MEIIPITAYTIVTIVVCSFIVKHEYTTDEQLDRLSYRYDADGAFMVCDESSNKCGLYVGTKSIKKFTIENSDFDLLGDVTNIPAVIVKEGK